MTESRFPYAISRIASSVFRLWVVVIIGVLTTLYVLQSPLWPFHSGQAMMDQGVYAYVARTWLAGGMPYVDAWDHKGPLTYAFYALGLLISGQRDWGVNFISGLALLSTALLLYKIAREFFGEDSFANRWATAVVPIYLFIALTHAYTGGGLEEDLCLPFTALALWLAIRYVRYGDTLKKAVGYSAAIGACMAVPLLVRADLIAAYLGIYSTLAIASWQIGRRKLLIPSVLGVVVGLGIIAVPVLAYFSARGALPDLKAAYLGFNLLYVKATLARKLLALYSLLKLMSFHGGESIAIIFGLGLGVHQVFRAPKALEAWRRTVFIGIIISTLCVLGGSASSGHVYTHYAIPWALFAALWAGQIVEWSISQATDRPARWLQYAAPPVILLAIGLGGIAGIFKNAVKGLYIPDNRAVRTLISAETSPADPIFVWHGPASLYDAVHRRAPSRFFFSIPILTPGFEPASFEHTLTAWNAKPPRIFVDFSENRDFRPDSPTFASAFGNDLEIGKDITPLRQFILTHYKFMERINNGDVYKLNATAP